MNKVTIVGVSPIRNDKNGQPLNLFVLRLANGKPNLIRTEKEFLTDLQNSFLIDDRVTSSRHPSVLSAMKDMKGATITGEFIYVKKDDKWTVTKDSSVMTKKSHPDFGKYAIGDKIPYKADATIVTDGFLDITFHAAIDLARRKAEQYGIMSAQDSMLDTASFFEDTAESSAEPIDVSAIDDEVIAAATGTDTKAAAKGK